MRTRTLLALALLAACGSTKEALPAEERPVRAHAGEPAAPLPEPAPWTEEFMQKALLLADRIRVEGPTGLLDHVVVRSDDALYNRVVKTTEEGFLQVTRVKGVASGQGRQPVHRELVDGQLDAWQLAAYEEIVLLERPGEVPVTVVAVGDVLWEDPDGNRERGPRLEFRGEIHRGAPPPPEAGDE